MDFIEVGHTDQVPPGTMRSFNVNGTDVLLVNVEGNYYAIGGRCTHRNGDLSQGKLEGKIVTCPRHGSRFDVTTGEALSGPKIGPLKLTTGNEPRYEVRIEGNTIQVKI